MSIALSAVRTLSSVEKSCTAKKTTRHSSKTHTNGSRATLKLRLKGRERGWMGGRKRNTHARAQRERKRTSPATKRGEKGAIEAKEKEKSRERGND